MEGGRGHRGFEKVEDLVKHVARENGIQQTDEKNIKNIPKHADSLKIFHCKYCPGEVRMLVGLSEKICLAYITTNPGNKVGGRMPEKLPRDCRICGKVSATDTELGEHMKLHTRMTPLAGLGLDEVQPVEKASRDL